MNMPPPGGWPPPQQPGPPPYGESHPQPQFGSQPPSSWQQGNWPQQPTPPPQKQGGSLKWLLIGVAVLLVVAISVGATLLFTRDDRGAASTPTSGGSSDIASANDTKPVSIITDEPTCASYMPINNSIANVEANGWGAQRSSLGPVSGWTEEQRTQVQSVATAMRNAADQVVPLTKQTPHRVVRELYEQFIAYGRAYAQSIETYTPADNEIATANVNAGSALAGICNAITYGSAARSVALQPAAEPSNVAQPADPRNPDMFVTSASADCVQWVSRENQFTAATSDWANLDTGIAGSQWTPEQRSLQQAAVIQLSDWADFMETEGERSQNSAFQDFALLAALYIRAYLPLGDKYIDSDAWLTYTAFRLSNTISGACSAKVG